MSQQYTRNHADAQSIHRGGYLQITDPGAVGAGKFWVQLLDDPPFPLFIRNGDNTAWIQLTSVGAEPGEGGGGHVIYKGLTAYPQRSKLRFAGAGVTVTDDAANDTTVVTIVSTGGEAPGNAVMFLGEPLTLGGEPITLGAP